MAETIDEATIIAWVDGELDEPQAAQVGQAVSADAELATLADRHRRMKARFAAAFGPIAETPIAMPAPAPVIPLAAARTERQTRIARSGWSGWGVGAAIAASLLLGVFVGHGFGSPSGVADKPDALALSAPITRSLNSQLSGDGGVVRVVLSFKDRDGRYCRSFVGENLAGVACRDAVNWQLRYASPTPANGADYRMAGDDTGQANVVAAMIAGDPLDRTGEEIARKSRWR